MNIDDTGRHNTEGRINPPDITAAVTADPAIHATIATRISVNRAVDFIWGYAYKIAIRSSEL